MSAHAQSRISSIVARFRAALANTRDRTILCLYLTLFTAGCFSAYATGLYLLRGAAPFEANGTSLFAVVLMYLSAGLISGILLGLLLPLGRFKAGAMMVGAVAVLPMYLGAMFLVEGFGGWTVDDVAVVFLLSLLGGAILGWWGHSQVYR